MQIDQLPFNITLLNQAKIKNGLHPITVLDIHEGQTRNLHPQGLFSTEIFGRIGEEQRDTHFAYIDMKVSVLHPTIYKTLTRMKALYKGIMQGKTYAVWDSEIKDFVQSNETDGKTGYSFFIRHFKDVNFKRNNSKKRDLSIDVIEKFKDQHLTRYLVVIPAGLRDIMEQDNGGLKEDEINDLYRRAIGIARTVDVTDGNVNNPIHDTVRWNMQLTFNSVYENLRNRIEGKGGFIQGKWGKRSIHNGTRNVISVMEPTAATLDDPAMPDVNDTQTGLYQTMKGCLPVTIYCLKNSILSDTFSTDVTQVSLIDKKTLLPKTVEVDVDTVDMFTSKEGLSKLINLYKNTEIRHRPIEVNGHYLALLWDDGKYVKIVRDKNSLPEDKDPKYLRPITWCEFYYLSCYEKFNTLKVVVTRYPVTGIGSTYPSNVVLRSTEKSVPKIVLDSEWGQENDIPLAVHFPDTLGKGKHIDTGIVHLSAISGLGGDYDGDTVSFNFVYSKESIDKVNTYLNSKDAYLDPRGGLMQDGNDLIDWVCYNMSR